MKNGNISKNQILVVKFGGSSLSRGEKISKMAGMVATELKRGSKIVVVVSAMGKTTDDLIEALDEASSSRAPPIEMDDVIAMGERTSARIFSAALKAKGVNARYFDPKDPDWPIITDESFTNAEPLLKKSINLIKEHVAPLLEKGVTPVVPGFIGRTLNGDVSTLGRGGSDTTAFIVAEALSAHQVVLVTDVEGIMTADPKLIKNPKKLDKIDVERLVGLADSGSKFIHRKALKYKPGGIDVKVINSAHGEIWSEGTLVKGSFPESIVISLSDSPSVALTIVGEAISRTHRILKNVLDEIEKENLDLLGMSVNQDSLILYLPKIDALKVVEDLHRIVLKEENALALAKSPDLALVKIRGAYISGTPGVISSFSEALSSQGLNIYGMFTITSSIILFVDWKRRIEAYKVLEVTKEELESGWE